MFPTSMLSDRFNTNLSCSQHCLALFDKMANNAAHQRPHLVLVGTTRGFREYRGVHDSKFQESFAAFLSNVFICVEGYVQVHRIPPHFKASTVNCQLYAYPLASILAGNIFPATSSCTQLTVRNLVANHCHILQCHSVRFTFYSC